MSGLELNKIIAAVLVAGLIGMTTGNIADILYKPNINAKHGYTVEVTETTPQSTTVPEDIEVKVDVIALLAKANVENGANLIKKCTICHDLTKDGPNRVGPNLWGIITLS